MATDGNLWFHGTAASGTTITYVTTGQAHPSVDLGSSTINRALLMEMRLGAAKSGDGPLDVYFQDSTDNTTFTTMPGSTGQILGFARQATHSYSSTDAVAADAPARILLRTDKRYVRMVSQTSTTTVFPNVSVVAKPMGGAFTGGVGPRDT